MQGQTFADNVTLLQVEAARITQYLTNLPLPAWSQPSACGAWQVQDVVAHLVGVAGFYADNIARGLQGDTDPPPGRPPAGMITAAVAAESVAKRAIAERQQLGARLLEAFREANAHLAQRLIGLPADAQQTPCYHPGGITQVQQFVDLRLKELALHEWDIRASLEPPGHLASACLPAILRLIDGAISSGSLQWGFRRGDRLASPVRYRFDVTEPVAYQCDLVVSGDALRQETGSQAPADVVFRCDTATFVLLVYGRLQLDRALHNGQLIAEGDTQIALAFPQWFTGI